MSDRWRGFGRVRFFWCVNWVAWGVADGDRRIWCVSCWQVDIGVVQVGHGFYSVDWAAKIDFFWWARLAASHAKGLYLLLLR